MRNILYCCAVLFLSGCAGMVRGCSSEMATSFGADWVVVQLDMNGTPFRCWQLNNTSITNESASDGIYWLDNETGHLVHISGLYNRVQVRNGEWSSAFAELGLDAETCGRIYAKKVEVE